MRESMYLNLPSIPCDYHGLYVVKTGIDAEGSRQQVR